MIKCCFIHLWFRNVENFIWISSWHPWVIGCNGYFLVLHLFLVSHGRFTQILKDPKILTSNKHSSIFELLWQPDGQTSVWGSIGRSVSWGNGRELKKPTAELGSSKNKQKKREELAVGKDHWSIRLQGSRHPGYRYRRLWVKRPQSDEGKRSCKNHVLVLLPG